MYSRFVLKSENVGTELFHFQESLHFGEISRFARRAEKNGRQQETTFMCEKIKKSVRLIERIIGLHLPHGVRLGVCQRRLVIAILDLDVSTPLEKKNQNK